MEGTRVRGLSRNSGMGFLLRGRRNCLGLAAILVTGLGGLPPALAQDDPHQKVRDSLVHIQMSGETLNGAPLASVGTGFLVSKDGYILTAEHLLEVVLDKGVPDKVEIWVSI